MYHSFLKNIRLNKWFSIIIVSIITVCSSIVLYLFIKKKFHNDPEYYLYFLVMIPLAWGLYRIINKKHIRRAILLRTRISKKWRKHLEEYVPFYCALDEIEKRRFEKLLIIFLYEHRITGVGATIDDATRIFIGCSAIIPIFYLPEWEYNVLGTIFVYPGPFQFHFNRNTHSMPISSGMVGNATLLYSMGFSQPDLLHHYLNPESTRNVGIHEFVHLIDKSDGSMSGLFTSYLSKEDIKYWWQLVALETSVIELGQSIIDPYAATSPVEFFAVTSEYFFMSPHLLYDEHPELYQFLCKIFKQDPLIKQLHLVKNVFQSE